MDNRDHGSMQGMDHSTMQGMDHGTMQGMDHGTMQGMDQGSMQGMDHGTMQGMDQGSMQGMDHSTMQGMDHGSMQGGSAPADARDPHAFSDGYDFGPIPRPRLGDEHNFASIRVDRLERVRTNDDTSGVYDIKAWIGRDYDRAVFKSEGDVNNGVIEEATTELLWSHALTSYWNSQLGARIDSGEGPNRSWLAFGFQGLAPYWFEVDTTAYVGEEGRSALNLEAEYEILFTQKLILQPRIEVDLYGKDDPERGIGSGLSSLAAGIRLRYEIRREFATYLGVEWSGKFGSTADYARNAGLDPKETRFVAGFRFWF